MQEHNQDSSIHDFEIQLICEFFSGVPRQGPGSPEETLKALSFIGDLTEQSLIADLGCGTGGQTMVLARNTPGQITGLDLFPAFVDLFNKNAAENGVSNRVRGVVGSMDQLPFEPESLDVIWSEGAIYNIGFQRGLREWRPFIKPGGFVAVTEASWFTNERPDEIHQFWTEAYPEIDTIGNKVMQMEQAGYIPLAAFIIPEKCWTEHFFAPQKEAQEKFLKKYAGNKTAENLVAYLRHEAELYRKYKSFYGYVFFIGQKIINFVKTSQKQLMCNPYTLHP